VWNTYDFGTLFLPTAAIFIVSAAVSLRVTGSVAGALAASLFKAGLFLFYFSMMFDDTYVLLDDQAYIRGGEELFTKGIGPFNFVERLPELLVMAGGTQFVYYLYNAVAVSFFGSGYFAPVALNVILTAPMAALGTRLAEREFGFSGPARTWFFYYFFLFPDVLAWSTIVNDKDILVLFLHVVLLIGFSLWFRNRIVRALFLMIPASVVLLFLRFYVPLFFSAAFAVTAIVGGRFSRRLYGLVAGTLLVAGAATAIGPRVIELAVNALRDDLVNPATGFLYFLLTPIPFNTEANYAFLDMPAAIHWILMPFAVFGVYRIYRLGTPFSRFFLVYFFTFAALYSIFGELQGPRHRVQLDFAWAVFQFAGLLALVRDALSERSHTSSEAQGA
jgi:hypothetical protein